MVKKAIFTLVCTLLAVATFLPASTDGQAAQSGVMICRTNINGVWQGTSCTVVTPSAPCNQITVCDGCGCWDTNSAINPNSNPPNVVGKKILPVKDKIQ